MEAFTEKFIFFVIRHELYKLIENKDRLILHNQMKRVTHLCVHMIQAPSTD